MLHAFTNALKGMQHARAESRDVLPQIESHVRVVVSTNPCELTKSTRPCCIRYVA